MRLREDGGAAKAWTLLTRTPQPGLWFIAGSFGKCRIYSKYLALQIKARDLARVTARTAALSTDDDGGVSGLRSP